MNNINSIYNLCFITYILIKNFLKYLYFKNDLLLLKNITRELEKINIVYIKIFQTLCINKHLFSKEQIEYLTYYTDNVPYISLEKDLTFLDTFKEKGLTVTNIEPINSGIIALVYEGYYGTNKVAIKILKKGIKQKLFEALKELELFCLFLSYIPYIRYFQFDKILDDNKINIINQVNFKNEVNNLKLFRENYKNQKNFIIPEVFQEFTEIDDRVIVMEFISGLKITQVQNKDDLLEFSKLLLKINLNSMFFHRLGHADLHIGNIIFINENPKKIALIDFGLIMEINREEQNLFYNFCKEIFYKKNYEWISDNLSYFCHPNENWNKLSNNQKIELENLIIEIIKNCKKEKEDLLNLFYKLSKEINRHNLYFIKGINQVQVSIAILFGLIEYMSNGHSTQIDLIIEIINELCSITELNDDDIDYIDDINDINDMIENLNEIEKKEN